MSRRTRGRLTATLDNFMGTYFSRYSDWLGYWLFGFLVADLREAEIDLLDVDHRAGTPWARARWLAATLFAEQAVKNGLRAPVVQASLRLRRDGPRRDFECWAGRRNGWWIEAASVARLECGTEVRRESGLFVAPHDPRLESASGSWTRI